MTTDESHLVVYANRSVLVSEDGNVTFLEGNASEGAKSRLSEIKEALRNGFLEDQINDCKRAECNIGGLDPAHAEIIETLVDSVSSNFGRGVVGLTVLQLCAKSISPEQDIRLHKSGGGARNFSWREGIPMRAIDKPFITPVLREHGLLSLNADGCMMSRTLAENYPYSMLYKAVIRGAKEEWLQIVDLVESGNLDPTIALKKILILLHQRSARFNESADKTLEVIHRIINEQPPVTEVSGFIKTFVRNTDYSARIFEVALHSLFQALEDSDVFHEQGVLEPLSQMRSANKKHGNVGDIEITERAHSNAILEAWDAKYGKPYLRDELEELNEKLSDHPEATDAGFVVDEIPDLGSEITERKEEIEILHDVKITIIGFEDWIRAQLDKAEEDDDKLACNWLLAFAESLCQRRRERAPIDEPSDEWVNELRRSADEWWDRIRDH